MWLLLNNFRRKETASYVTFKGNSVVTLSINKKNSLANKQQEARRATLTSAQSLLAP